MDTRVTITTNEGKTLECDVVARWNDGCDYIAYTTDDDNLYISKYRLDNEDIILDTITDDEEWDRVNKFLDEYFSEDDDYEVRD